MALRKVDTATLVRGQVYTLRHPDFTPQNPKESLRFKRGVPVIIDDPKILRKLEDLVDEIPDGDGEITDKPIFSIKRGVIAPDDDEARPRRVSAEREIKLRPSGVKPKKLRRG